MSTAAAAPRRLQLSQYVRPLLPVIPNIQAPDRRVPWPEKISWTLFSLLLFLVASQIPLYGIQYGNKNDPFYWLRIILASNRGTLMELGIAPIVTTSMMLQFLAGSKIIEIDQDLKEDRRLFAAAQKLAGIVFTFIQATSYVTAGMYGDPSDLGSFNCLMIIGQLTMSGFLVLMIDELLSKGWGIGSGISLFIATNICETIIWKAFSFAHVQTPYGSVYEGAMTSFVHQLLMPTQSGRLSAITEAFYRPYGANLTNLIATFVVFLAVVYFQGFRIDLPIKSVRVRGHTGNYPIRLFYTSNMPIILHSALISNVYFFSQLLHKRFKNSFLIGLLGQWQEVDYINESYPVGGLVYYLAPPTSILDFMIHPVRGLVYCGIVCTSCAMLSKAWVEISGDSPREVAKRLKDQQLSIAGHREPLGILYKHIPQAAQLGGIVIALLTIAADLLGAVGSGTGILLAVTITYSMFETMAKEGASMQQMMSMGQ